MKQPFVLANYQCNLADSSNGNRARAFLALFDLEFNLVAFVKRLEAVPDYSCVMNEKIRPIIMGKKSKTFFLVKPFDCSFSHLKTPVKIFRALTQE